jgi:hypothetical protein
MIGDDDAHETIEVVANTCIDTPVVRGLRPEARGR